MVLITNKTNSFFIINNKCFASNRPNTWTAYRITANLDHGCSASAMWVLKVTSKSPNNLASCTNKSNTQDPVPLAAVWSVTSRLFAVTLGWASLVNANQDSMETDTTASRTIFHCVSQAESPEKSTTLQWMLNCNRMWCSAMEEPTPLLVRWITPLATALSWYMPLARL